MLPLVPAGELASRADMERMESGLRGDMERREAGLRGDMAGVRGEMFELAGMIGVAGVVLAAARFA